MTTTPDYLSTKRAWDLMSRCVVVVSKDASLSEAADVLARAGVTGVPVVDESGRCVGVLSKTDIVMPHKLNGELVTDYMTKNPVTVLPHATIHELARLMLDERIHRVIVVDTAEHPIGIVTNSDIVAAVVHATENHDANE
jgi:CBS domain-containing protein